MTTVIAAEVPIKPENTPAVQHRTEIVQELTDTGLIENLPGVASMPSPELRIYLAERLSQGQPLSELILMDRDEYA